MSELLPTIQSQSVRTGLSDYLATTFALSDTAVQDALVRFLEDPDHGMFSGPYVQARMPFRPADDGWRDALDHYSGFAPYGHQAAAFQRLTSNDPDDPTRLRRPDPTLVTTGTGSGKTEAFLAPILDHVVRARDLGITGIKALILYPMNALANDQAQRLAETITTTPEFAGVRAGIYVGAGSSSRTRVSPEGLITDRHAVRDDPPDILLTNYKMLDQLLLRPDDAPLWQRSASSLTYLVLDEFHTYDGAQGTDVAMLLRRLGLRLKAHWPDELPERRTIGPVAADRERPLGMLTPVATSATLGGPGDPEAMLAFARTVFGEQFPSDAVITESRLTVADWAAERPVVPAVAPASLPAIARHVDRTAPPEEDDRLAAVWAALFASEAPDAEPVAPPTGHADQANALAHHPTVQRLLAAAQDAVGLDDLARTVFQHPDDPPLYATMRRERRSRFVADLLAVLSHLRADPDLGRRLPNIEVHLWVRELSRLNRAVDPTPAFTWADDGDPHDDRALPAVFCRHCGRSGWGVEMSDATGGLLTDAQSIRRTAAGNRKRFRVLLYAPEEGELHLDGAAQPPDPRLAWYDAEGRDLVAAPDADSEAFQEGLVLPVLAHRGDDADEASEQDRCPACREDDAIRFVGSAIATLLSVAITTLFGQSSLDEDEKKALVFTDSVQDAAHRAGFVQSRSHVFSLRSTLGTAVPAEGSSLRDLVRTIVDSATTPGERFALIPPDLSGHPAFRPFWDADGQIGRTVRTARQNVERRLLFDAELEFGLNSHLGRTLELTGTLAAEVDATAPQLLSAARTAWDRTARDANLLDVAAPDDGALLAWARGTVERIRRRGGIAHDWLDKYLSENGRRYFLWGGRNRNQGAPAFPKGRPAPAFPQVGKNTGENLDPVAGSRGWYARWAARCLGTSAGEGGFLARNLFTQLAERDVLQSRGTSAGEAFTLADTSIVVSPVEDNDLATGRAFLECTVCHALNPTSPEAHPQLRGAPCFTLDCVGTLEESPQVASFYRSTYTQSRMRRVIAHEHTSLLPDDVRLRAEDQFKSSGAAHPDAPNVLVATPTLEMGIDIGDLSTVMLSSLPSTVSSYLQRVGRAGRLTGNALIIAFVQGRGEHLPKIHEPLSVLNGTVRPPATYLGAEEILRRQYLAFLLDRLARRASGGDVPGAEAPRRGALLASIAEGTLLGDLVRDHDAHADTRREEFLSAFGDELDDRATAEFTAWTRPGDTGSPLWATVAQASQRYAADLAEISERITRIDEVLPELEAAAQAPAGQNDDEVQRAPLIALAGLRNLRRMRSELSQDHWIATFERYGLLPNFTLIDDTVDLDVEITSRDLETDEFVSEALSFERGAASALTEFAPGNTFYGHGREITIDAVDMGSGGAAVQRWQVCPACGWVEVLLEGALTAEICARCGTSAVRDVSQVLDVLPFTSANAVVRRDESAISDRSDDRVRTPFEVVTLADLPPEHTDPAWWVDGYPFGAQMAHRATIRTLNLGRRGPGGSEVTLAGDTYRAPRFRVCASCGQVDSSVRANARSEHRPWCPFRKSDEEHARSIVLAHELVTQGVLLRLPRSVTARSGFALPSLKAAVLLGLREVLGGEPGHLAILQVPDADRSAQALFLHDRVPGGTGYLLAFSTPEGVRELLERSYRVVAACPCRGEDRTACHRCLLPFAAPREVSEISRAVAADALAQLLSAEQVEGSETFDPSAADRQWQVSHDAAPPADEPESHLEIRFRAALSERLRNADWRIRERPGDGGMSVVEFTDPSGRRWTLSPQPELGFTQPDFELSRRGRPDDRLLIYTDGLVFHASQKHNRIADDAMKRARLRDDEHGIPWSVTSRDVAQFEAVTAARASNAPEPDSADPPWFDPALMTRVLTRFALDRRLVAAVRQNAMEQLVLWMQHPDRSAWAQVADGLPVVLGARAQRDRIAPGDPADLAVQAMDGAAAEPGEAMGLTYRHGALVVSAVGPSPNQLRVAAVLDDRAPAHNEAFADQWREWLHLANLLAFRRTSGQFTSRITSRRRYDEEAALATAMTEGAPPGATARRPTGSSTTSPGAGATTPIAGADTRADTGAVPARAYWLREIEAELEFTDPEYVDLLGELAEHVGIPRPEVGREVGGEVVEFAWQTPGGGPGLAVGVDDAAQDEVAGQGWRVVTPQTAAVLEALRELGIADRAGAASHERNE